MSKITITLAGNTVKSPVCSPNPAHCSRDKEIKWKCTNHEWEVRFADEEYVTDSKVSGGANQELGVKFRANVWVGQRIKYWVKVKEGDNWYGDDPELIVDE